MRRRRGDTLLIALGGLAAAGVLSLVVVQSSRIQTGRQRGARVKSIMAEAESKLRTALFGGYLLTNCRNQGGQMLCDLNIDQQVAPIVERPVIGAKCPDTQPACGIILDRTPGGHLKDGTPLGWDPVSRTLALVLKYAGQETSLSPQEVKLSVPADVVQQEDLFMCPPDKPVFAGYDKATALPVCRPLPAPCGGSTDGRYAYAVGTDDLSLQCAPMPSVDCGSTDTYINSLNLQTGAFSCTTRFDDPFSIFGGGPKP